MCKLWRRLAFVFKGSLSSCLRYLDHATVTTLLLGIATQECSKFEQLLQLDCLYRPISLTDRLVLAARTCCARRMKASRTSECNCHVTRLRQHGLGRFAIVEGETPNAAPQHGVASPPSPKPHWARLVLSDAVTHALAFMPCANSA